MLKDLPQSLTNANILGQGNLNLVSEKSGKNQGILLSVICGNPDKVFQVFWKIYRDQARGRLGRNSRPRDRNFALNGTQGEVGVSLKKKKKIRETHFHSVTTQMQAVVTLSDNLLPLHRVSPSIKWKYTERKKFSNIL